MTQTNIDVIQVVPYPSWTTERLEAHFTIHRTWDAADLDSLMPTIAGSVRGMSTMAPQGADRALIERFPNLEIIAANSVGVDPIDLDCARERGIIVTNTPGVLTECVADHGMALVLAVMRRVAEGDRFVRARHWLNEPLSLGSALRGKTLGIVGLGRIGKALASRAEAFGMCIAYHGRGRQDGVDYPYYETAEALAAASDVLALTCPGGPETLNMVNVAVLKALGPAGFLVNVARGSVVDEPALVAALQADEIAGASLDVFVEEPRMPEELYAMENVVLQPHQASATVETRKAMGDLMIDNLIRHFAGEPVLTPVV